MKKLTKSKSSRQPKSRCSNPETIEEQLIKLENSQVEISIWDNKLNALRVQEVEGLLTKISSAKSTRWGIVKNREVIVFDTKLDDVHIKNSKLFKQISILVNFPKRFFED